MLCREARDHAREFVLGEVSTQEGFHAAHFVGSITAIADDAAWPDWKDVDVLLVFEEGSPALAHGGPFSSNLEVSYRGLMIEGGYKPVTDYASAEAVLANPEIAHHFLSDCIVTDPEGTLSALLPDTRANYALRPWVEARLAREWEMAQVPRRAASVAGQMPGGYIGMSGYTFTFISVLFSIAQLRAPSTGPRLMAGLRETTAALGRPEMYDRMIEILGVRRLSEADFSARIGEVISAFDEACALRRTPGPFTHKLYPHLRPYCIDSVQALHAQGETDSARGFLIAVYNAIAFVHIVDGNEQQRELWGERMGRFMASLGVDGPEEGKRRLDAALTLLDESRDLASEIARTNPAVRDN